MKGNTAILNNNNGDNDDEDTNDLPQADSPYMHFLDSEKRKNYSRRKLIRYVIIGVIALIVITTITVIILAVILAHNESDESNNVGGSSEISQQICDNPPIIHVSLDGYRADYYERMLNPNLQFIIDTGVRADYMRSQYPTLTFPNHYTIMTRLSFHGYLKMKRRLLVKYGLYPEYHGIVANRFYDKDTNELFQMSTESHWWFGEPLWVTARNDGLVTGVYFWPGSEVPGIQPDYYFDYNGSVPYQTRVNTVLGWLDLPEDKRPQFIALYFDQPDHNGHLFGPDSSGVNESIQTVDTSLGRLIDGLMRRNILDCVNLIVTSDHGMQAIPENQTLYLEDYIGNLTDGIKVSSLGVVVQFNIYPPADKASFYNKLINLPHAQVFYQRDVPYRLRVGHNFKNRYGDIVVVLDPGWFVTSRSIQYRLNGSHGYDNNAKTMRGFMAARGPAFKENFVSDGFDNIQLYNLECALLGIPPAPNNGTFGALYNLLKPEVVEKLPEEQSFEPINSDHVRSCQVSDDAVELLNSSSGCHNCLCSSCQFNISMLLEATTQLSSLTLEQISYYQSYHVIGGIPQGGGGSGSCLLTDQQKIIKYSTMLHIPLWVAYRLDANDLTFGSQNFVTNCSVADFRLSETHSAKCDDFNVPNYVRGTLANFGDSITDQFFTSQVPQLQGFYQDVWQVLQEKLLGWTVAYSSIHLISGSILDSDHNGFRDSDEDYNRWTNDTGSVAIPTQFYSIAIRCKSKSTDIDSCAAEDIQALGIVIYHEEINEKATNEFFEFRITSVREIEILTDINFFPELTANQQNKIELEIITDLWPEYATTDHTYRCYTCSDCSFPSNLSILEERSRCADCICPYCKVNKTFAVETNRVFNVSELEVHDYLFYHLPLGVPQGSDDEACVLTHFYYIIKYSTFYHIPLWVAYKLNGSDLANGLDRRDCFRRDPRIPITESSNCSDYRGSGFDRGHLAPNGDFNYNRVAQLSTFVLTNIAPQYHALNAGAWLVAENKVREWANTYSVIYVISGSILGESRRDQEGNYEWWIGGYGHAAVPTHFYKILSRCSNSSTTSISDCPIYNLETLTFLFEHLNSGVPSGGGDTALLEALTTIRNIETLSGMDFFTHLSKEDQDIIELKMATTLWE